MNNSLFYSNLRRLGFALIGIVALVAVALPSAAFAASGPIVAEASSDSIQVENGKHQRGKGKNYGYNYNHSYNYGKKNMGKRTYGYSYSKATKNYEKRYGSNNYSHNKYQKNYGNYGYDHGYDNNKGYDNYGKKGYHDGYQKHDKPHQSYCDHSYKVKRGDTLSSIAQHYHVTVYSLTHANNIHNANRIYVGQHLCIPDGYAHRR